MTAVEHLPPELENLPGLISTHGGWMALCPAHDDRNPSLSIKLDGGTVLLHCHAGCTQAAVLDAAGWRPDTQDRGEWTPRGEAVAVYDYRSETGTLLFQVLRTADKQFPQRRPDPTKKSGWSWSLGDTRRVLYRLPELIQAVEAGQTVYVVEGEKDVLTLVAHGKAATCNPGGAGKWREEYAPHMAEAKVIIIADKDDVGRAHARKVKESLLLFDCKVWIMEAAADHKDITDHLAAGLTFKQLVKTNDAVDPAKPDLAVDIVDFVHSGSTDYDWLVPGLLERRDRLILTGEEGLGKTMWMRQVAVALAAGLHPFKLTSLARPLRVLVIDAENSEQQNRRKYRPLIEQAETDQHPVRHGQMWLIPSPNGKDLAGRDGDDAAWLLERVVAHQPDVLIIGPLYNLHMESPNDETVARKLVAAITAARDRVGCAVLIEAHAGHGYGHDSRQLRPAGSSLYLRWPEFGFGLRQAVSCDGGAVIKSHVVMKRWRGNRDERSWPKALRKNRSEGGLTGWAWHEEEDPEILKTMK